MTTGITIVLHSIIPSDIPWWCREMVHQVLPGQLMGWRAFQIHLHLTNSKLRLQRIQSVIIIICSIIIITTIIIVIIIIISISSIYEIKQSMKNLSSSRGLCLFSQIVFVFVLMYYL